MPAPHLFVSYAREDRQYVDEFLEFLAPLPESLVPDRWDDSRIQSGQTWLPQLRRALDTAAGAMLFVSPSFLASPFIRSTEIPPLLAAYEREGRPVFCVFVRPCVVERVHFEARDAKGDVIARRRLTDFQGLNQPDRPVALVNERPHRDAVYLAMTDQLLAAIKAAGGSSRRLDAAVAASGGGEADVASPPRTTRRTPHAEMTLERLARPEARAFLHRLASELGVVAGANADGNAAAGAVVDRMVAAPEREPSLSHLDVVTRALDALDWNGLSKVHREAIAHAAAALYFIRAMHLVSRAAAESGAPTGGGHALCAPLDAPILCAVLTAELFGGKIVVERSPGSTDLRPRNIHVIRPLKSGRLTFDTIVRQVYVAEFGHRRRPDGSSDADVTLDAGPLDAERWNLLLARIRRRREVRDECFALVIPRADDAAEAARLSGALAAPVFFGAGIGDPAVKSLFRIDPGLLHGDFVEFCNELDAKMSDDPSASRP